MRCQYCGYSKNTREVRKLRFNPISADKNNFYSARCIEVKHFMKINLKHIQACIECTSIKLLNHLANFTETTKIDGLYTYRTQRKCPVRPTKSPDLLPAINYWLTFTADWFQGVILSDQRWFVLQHSLSKQTGR